KRRQAKKELRARQPATSPRRGRSRSTRCRAAEEGRPRISWLRDFPLHSLPCGILSFDLKPLHSTEVLRARRSISTLAKFGSESTWLGARMPSFGTDPLN